tara:strand:- start:193 stop:489 length:297 start_codon:yes stop_codon:yes gene_type:complete
MYREQIEARNVKVIDHYNTPNMMYPDFSQMKKITTIKHVWSIGDRYYKLAHKHYGQAKLWWLIAWFNKAPTESHLSLGQVIKIPTPLVAALSYMRNTK